jgi:hypothetical protein
VLGGIIEQSVGYKLHRFPPDVIAHATWLFSIFISIASALSPPADRQQSSSLEIRTSCFSAI